MQVSVPSAVEPFYTCARRNQPIVLFRGRVDLVGTTSTERHRGGIVLDWLPSPTVRCWVRGPASELATESIMGGAEVEIVPRIPPRRVPRQSRTTRGGPRSALQGFETGSQLLGVEKENGGFGLTHTARVQRTSGGTFTAAKVNTLVEAFTYFCWLCAEARCGPLLPVGFDGQDSAVWSRWNPTRTESFTRAATWLDTVHAGEAEALFPAFMARFGDPYWREVLIHAVEYLVEAGRPNTLQRAIVMAQILLETLSRSHTHEERAACRWAAGAGAHPQRDHPPPAPRGDRTPRLRSAHRRLAARRVVLGAGRSAPVRVRRPVPKPAQRQRVDRCGGAGAVAAGRTPAGPGAC